MAKKFRVTFYTNVIYPSADGSDSDQFTRFYEVDDNYGIEQIALLVESDLLKNNFLKDELNHTHWFYKTADVTSFSIREMD